MSDDTVGIPTAPEAVAERLRAETKRVQQADAWIGKLIGFGVTAMALGLLSVIVLASMLTRGPIAEHWRQTWNALGLALFIAGVATACSGLIISSARRRAQLARLEQAARHLEILAAIRDLPSVEDVYRITAMQEATQLLVGQLQVRIAANEEQRLSDIDAMRDNARKAIEALHEQMDRVNDGATELAERTARRAYAAGLRDLILAMREEAEQRRDDATAAQPNGSQEVVDPKYLVDMSEAIRLGRELERRQLLPPESPN